MANLPETNGMTFPAVRQIENGETQAGGPNGLWNEHAKDMIERTAFLRRLLQIGGLDLENFPSEANRNEISGSGFFRFLSSAANAPAENGVPYDAAGMQIKAANQTFQIASLSETRPLLYRIKDDAAGPWSAWFALVDERSGMGAHAAPVTDLNAINRSMFFFAASTAANNPSLTQDVRGLSISSHDGAEQTQIAVGTGSAFYFRDKDDAAGPWSPWRTVLHDQSAASVSYSSSNAPDAWIVSANVKGDTSVTLGAVSGRCLRLGNLAHVHLAFDIGSFSVPASDDATVSFTLDMAALGVAAGWFASISQAAFGNATAEWVISGLDTPPFALDCTANSAANTLYFQNVDTTSLPSQASPATGLSVRMNITMMVGD
ncbi:MAG: hypothetical protein E6Q97_31625 [Desulfurellales bacterium]|nr:MAG: hypothetical protein E6Q97_31625 [Desulfurellales bacterium]